MNLKCYLMLFFLNLLETISAKEINYVQVEGELEKKLHYSVNATDEIVVLFNDNINSTNPYRINVWTLTKPIVPVIVVIKQEFQVISWQIPDKAHIRNDSNMYYLNTSRTLCVDSTTQINGFFITLASASPIDVFVKVEEVKNYFIQVNHTYSIDVSPSQTTFFYYQSANSVIVKIVTDNDICLTVSIQRGICPVFALNEDVFYQGIHQTVIRKGGTSIPNSNFPNGFFLVFVPKVNYSDCYIHSVLPSPQLHAENTKINIIGTVNFTVMEGPSSDRYFFASLSTITVLLLFFISIIVFNLCFEHCGSCYQPNNYNHIEETNTIEQEQQEGNGFEEVFQQAEEKVPNTLTPDELLERSIIKLNFLANSEDVNQKRSYNYLYHIINTAVFYSIPVIQLVIVYQRIVNSTGDQDLCYYNFLCAHPAFGFSDFNHIFSNLGYIVVGILFILVVFYRHIRLPRSDTGVPIQYGFYYAMGVSLIFEGVLSGAYHVCPSQSNFQFDTSFMYAMLVLCLVKLYQNRHPDINPTSYTSFSVLGCGIFSAMVGVLSGDLAIWIVFGIIYFLFCLYLSLKVYFVHNLLLGLKKFKEAIKSNGFFSKTTLVPIKKPQFIAICLGNVVNFSLVLLGIISSVKELTDFATFILILLMVNVGLYCLFYVFMKLFNKEKLCIEACVYGILSIFMWGYSISFFIDNATVWKDSPALSRNWNQPCSWLEFYDQHDMWHLLSAFALFFSFVFLLCIDDDLRNTSRNKIVVF